MATLVVGVDKQRLKVEAQGIAAKTLGYDGVIVGANIYTVKSRLSYLATRCVLNRDESIEQSEMKEGSSSQNRDKNKFPTLSIAP